MPADEIEVHRRRRGRHPPAQPARPARSPAPRTARLTGLRTVRCTAVFDANGSFNPSFDETPGGGHPSRQRHLRHRPDLRPLLPRSRRRRGERARPHQGEPRDVPDHRARRLRLRRYRPRRRACSSTPSPSAQIAARSMHDFLRGTRTEVVVRKKWCPPPTPWRSGWNVIARENPPSLESDQRAASLEIVEEGYTEAKARAARRRAACAATSTPSSTRRNAWPATAAWTSARRT